jgi:two-component system sensor histidine kinase KdpD
MEAKDIRKNWGVRERMAVCISSNPAGQYLIARGARMARRMDAELYVIHVDREFGPKESNQNALAANLRFAESLGANVVRLKGKSVADAVAEFVRSKPPCMTGASTCIFQPCTASFVSLLPWTSTS